MTFRVIGADDISGALPPLVEQNIIKTSDEYFSQTDYVEQIESKSSKNILQVHKTTTGESLEVVATSPSGAYTTYSVEGTNTGSGRDDYRIVAEAYTGTLPTKSTTYNDLTRTGTFSATADIYAYTSQVGATFDLTIDLPFTGSEVRFFPYKDNRGGVWRMTFAGRSTDISTYSASGAQESNGFLVSPPNTPKGRYTLHAEFMGDDPLNPPSSGAGTARGWLARVPSADGSTTTYPGTYDNIKYPDITAGWTQGTLQGVESNREFAWWFRPVGSAVTAQWVPYHGVDTAFNVESTQFFDGDRPLNVFRMAVGEKQDLTGTFKMVQHIYGRIPNYSTSVNLIEVWTTTTIHPTGRMTVEGRIKVLQDIEVTNAFVIMHPVNSALFDTVVSSIGNTYPNTPDLVGTNTFLPESDVGQSYVFLSSTNPSLVNAFRYNNPSETLRRSDTDKPAEGTRAWLEHRTGGTILKHYQKLWATGAIVPAGTSLRFSGDYIFSEEPNSYGQLSL